ncbi:SCO2322 family protein [Streptomyces sp. NPDC085481]|uniref:SCO2322 family protein n=1 Tax=Streptomyces sp. NPDC085481 TaxID=3365727 RepID=UPI0037D8C358
MRHRNLGAKLAAGFGAALLTVAVAAPAQAAGYRYWSFWEEQGGEWGYATQGPATARPADGDAIGFRFAVSRDSSDAAQPSSAPDFATICAGVEKKEGTKRIAVVVDFGGPQDAPPGETPPAKTPKAGCPQVRESATAAEALAAVAKPLRYDANALLCGIEGYPEKGCGEQVAEGEPTKPTGEASASGPSASASASSPPARSSSSASSSSSSDSGGPSVGLVVGGAAVLLLGTAGVVQARRRRG